MPGSRRLPKIRISKKDQRIARPPPGSLAHARSRADHTGADFPVGAHAIYLPTIVVALLHNPLIPPTHAQFRVPLHFNKLDLRDYLWHAYRLPVSSIRSNVVQQPVRYIEKYSVKDVPGRKIFFRPMSVKKMVVRLPTPFVWPELPAEGERTEAVRSEMEVYRAQRDGLEAQLDPVRREEALRGEWRAKIMGLRKRGSALFGERMDWRGDGREFATKEDKKKAYEEEKRLERQRAPKGKVHGNEAQVVPSKTAAEVVDSVEGKPNTPLQAAEPEDEVPRPSTHQERVHAKASFLRRNGLKLHGTETASKRTKQPLAI